LAKACAAGHGTGLLSSLFQDDTHPHAHPGLFLSTPLAAEHAQPLPTHADFLFSGSSPPLLIHKHFHETQAADFFPKLLSPKTSMLASALVAASTVMDKTNKHLDPFGNDDDEDPDTGWCKVVPRGLRIFLAGDVLSLAVVLKSMGDPCGVPLRAWLLGGICLGYPATYLVKRAADLKPRLRWYRLAVTGRRDGGDPNEAQLDSLQLHDQFGVPVHRSMVEQRHDGEYWYFSFPEAELVTGYQVVTHRTTVPAHDPVSWRFEGSVDGVDWRVLHECERHPVPEARSAPTEVLRDLAHLVDAVGAFRKAFLVEIAMTAASLTWLWFGTSWISDGTDSCLDSSPVLWYYCYLVVVFIWSFIGSITILLIISAVATVFLASREQRR